MCSGISAISLKHNMPVICCKSHEVRTCWKCIHLLQISFRRNASPLFKFLYISSTFANITTPFISENSIFSETPYFLINSAKSIGAMFFSFCKCFFSLIKKQNIFHFFFISFRMFRMTNFELTDWLIWFVHQFWLVHLNKHQLISILLTACHYYQLYCKYPQSMFKNVPLAQNKIWQNIAIRVEWNICLTLAV